MFIEIKADLNSLSLRSPVYGVGINDAWYMTCANEAKCPFYLKWIDMLERGYSKRLKEKYPTYKGVYVCDDWLVFSKFRSWMESKYWQGKELDKDIINPGNKVYSPSNCAFVDHFTNSILNVHKSSCGEFPPGVTKVSKGPGYIARVRNGKERKYLGYFRTVNEASNAYIVAKSKFIISCSKSQSDERVRLGLVAHSDILLTGRVSEIT